MVVAAPLVGFLIAATKENACIMSIHNSKYYLRLNIIFSMLQAMLPDLVSLNSLPISSVLT